MLQTQTVERSVFELLKKIMHDPYLSDFILAGGTNLALQLGHRKSIDLDLFPCTSFDALQLEKYLMEKYHFIPQLVAKNTAKGLIDGIKVDFITYNYPLLNPLFVEDHVRMYSMQDIACMKLAAISDNGTRLKDFVDIAYLSIKMSLMDMFDLYTKKYNRPGYFHVIKSLAYFKDIDFSTKIDLCSGKPFQWEKIERRIRDMIKYETKVFETPPQ